MNFYLVRYEKRVVQMIFLPQINNIVRENIGLESKKGQVLASKILLEMDVSVYVYSL